MNDDVVREHPAFRRWLVGLAGGMLLLLLLLPNTGWVVREHLCFQIFGFPAGPSLQSVTQLAARMPGDPQIQIAAGAMAGGMTPVLSLRERFPSDPAVLAAVLRAYTYGRFRLRRESEMEYLNGRQSAARQEGPELPVPPEYDDTAAAGEKADPGNAYFPLMRAVGYFAAHRDAEALDAVVRAGACSRWDDYIQQEALGRERIGDLLSGHASAMTTTALDAEILLPHLSQIRGAAELTTYRAAKLEEAGNTKDGLRLRMAVARSGELMRALGSNLITVMVGDAMVQIAQKRPGGETSTAERMRPPLPGSEQEQTADHLRLSRFYTYLEAHDHASEASWFREQERATEVSRQIIHMGADSVAFGIPSRKLYLLHAADALLLSNVLWLALAGMAGAVLCRVRRIAAGQPLPVPVRYTNMVLAVGVALLAAAGLVSKDYGLLLAPWVISGMAGAIFYFLVLRNYRLRDLTARAVFVTAGWSLLSAAIVAALGWVVSWQARGVQDLILWGASLLSWPGDQPVLAWWSDATVIGWLAVSVPLLLAVLLSGFSLVLRVPLSVGLARGFRRAALPVCCLLLMAYGGLILRTSVQEARVLHAIHREVEHEGNYAAERLGRQWPGLVR